jgi:hypothetical protein
MEKRMSKEIGVYGLGEGSRAWQPIVGCDPHMSCAPRCLLDGREYKELPEGLCPKS